MLAICYEWNAMPLANKHDIRRSRL